MTTKTDIVQKIAKQYPHLTQNDVHVIVDGFFKGIEEHFVNGGDTIEFRGFGVFSMRSRSARQGRNPNTGEAVQVPAKRILRFVASKRVKALLNT